MRRRIGVSLEEFIGMHDRLHHGPEAFVGGSSTTGSSGRMTDFARVMAMSTIKVDNNFPTTQGLWDHLDSLDLMDEERLRPGWDTYFMVSATLLSSPPPPILGPNQLEIDFDIDTGFTSFPSVELYETPCWGFAGSFKTYTLDWV